MKKIYFDGDDYLGSKYFRIINKFRVVDLISFCISGKICYSVESTPIKEYLDMFKEQIYMVCQNYQFDPTEIEKAINAVKSPDELIELHNDNHSFTYSENMCLNTHYVEYLFR